MKFGRDLISYDNANDPKVKGWNEFMHQKLRNELKVLFLDCQNGF
jgi:hypothetical protein